MFIWVACDIDKAFTPVRKYCQEQNKTVRLSEVAFTLPQHISLKISFLVPDTMVKSVVKDIADYLAKQKPFCVYNPKTEYVENILWITFDECSVLQRLHDELDTLLQYKHNVTPHLLDKRFIFHSTLFMDKNVKYTQTNFTDIPLPDSVQINGFFIGISPSGDVGSYRVIKTVKVLS